MDSSFSEDDIRKLVFVNFDPLIKPFEDSFRKQCSVFWTSDVVLSALSKDTEQWKTMSTPLRHTVSTLLHYLLAADAYASEFAEMTSKEFAYGNMFISACFQIHAAMENVHADTYRQFLVPIYGNDERQWTIAIAECMKSQASLTLLAWGKHYCNAAGTSPPKRILGMICYEGILFQPFFPIPYALKKHGLLPAFAMGNELIARDEAFHWKNYALLFVYLTNPAGPHKLERPSQSYVQSMFVGAVNCAKDLLKAALPSDLPEYSLLYSEIADYVNLTANAILVELKYDPCFRVDNPNGPAYMMNKDLPQYSSFHTTRPSEYAIATNDGRSLSTMLTAMKLRK